MRAYLGHCVRAFCVLGGLWLAAAPTALAQSDAATIAALQEKVDKLEERLQALEDKFVDVQGEGLKVKTPFSVVNESGGPVFQVIGTGGQSTFVFIGGDGPGTGGSKILLEAGTGASPGGRITLSGGSGAPVFQAGEVGGKATAVVGDKAGPHVLLESDGASVTVKTTSNGNTITLGDADGVVGLVLDIGGAVMAELSKWSDRQVPSLRINGTGGQQVAGVGADPANPTNGSINVMGSGAEVWMNGEGWLKLLNNNQEKIKLDALKVSLAMGGAIPEAIVLDAEKQTVTVKGGGSQQVVADGKKGFLALNGDKEYATLGLKSGSPAGQLLIYGGSGAPVFSATGEGSGGKVVVGDESTPHVEIDTNNGQAQISAEGTGDSNVAIIASSGTATLRVENSGGIATSLGENEGAIGLFIEMEQRVLGELSKRQDRDGASVRIFGPGGGTVAGLGGQLGDPDAGIVVASSPNGSATMTGAGWLGLREGNDLKAIVSAPDKVIALYGSGSEYIVTLSQSTSGGGNITTYDTGGSGVFSAGAATDGGGEACVQRQENGLNCLGVGLPGMGQGK